MSVGQVERGSGEGGLKLGEEDRFKKLRTVKGGRWVEDALGT
jgi:hypothetical protein